MSDDDSAKLDGDRWLTIAQVAEALGVSRKTVYAWRTTRRGPRGYRIGRFVRFRESDVLTWLESQRDEPSHNGSRPGRG